MKNSKAIVVGSGIAGIASALRLRAKGYDVEIFEANAYPGGKLTEISLGEFTFDAGPSLFTMPHLVDELFKLFHKDPKKYFDYIENETLCHYFFEDGTVLNFKKDIKQLKQEVESKLKVDFEPLKKHIDKSKYIYDATHHIFLEKSLHEPKNYLHLNVLKSVLKMPRLQLLNTMHKANESALNHPKLVQIFNRFATYNGSNPYQAPGILNIIPHLEHGIGSFFPTNGMHSITTSLIQLAKEENIQIHLNSKVSEIVVENNRVKGIKVNTIFHEADLVVCNADIKPAYKFLLPQIKKPKKRLAQEPSSSAMIFYWGINKVFPELDLHNILFSESYKAEFEAIFEKGTVIDDPTIYIHISSKIAKDHAPNNKENWFILVNVPANTGQNWDEIRLRIRQNVIAKVNRILNTDIESFLEEEDYLDPIRIEERTSSAHGALYGSSSNHKMSAFFRHPNFTKVGGLLFVGGSVHPGGGIPLCLLSAKIATSKA